ncbi:ribonuclease H-like domain-containing protein [Metabacillus litoralis]|uniref:ribonuclease H-like domain-containing protein n=1 Tax=Metabacillus litoralis TaxID=152268 RepID=UPI001CFCDAAB|nr:ribonuclease H-like domain-containing protein [Metabacillus litoralis]
MSLKNKLNRLKQNIVRDHDLPLNQEDHSVINETDLQWKQFDTAVYQFDGQKCFIREVIYPLDFKHGHYKLGDFHDVVSLWNNSDSAHPLTSKGHKSSDLFFFDTETTGLGGGVGNTIFLLGQAQVFHDRVVVRQYLLPQPGNEVALYKYFLQGINSKTLVTYNGKAFDWPQVKTRHMLIRNSVPSLPSFGHFDLFHAARRLWKNELESVRLSIVESEILGITREDDVPGYLAPMLYFQFVKQQQPEIITGVLKHNEIDVLSLITLYIHLSLKILKTDQEASGEEHYEIARWLDYVGDEKSAINSYKTLLNKDSKQEDKAKLALSLHYKKQKNWDEAIKVWNEILQINKKGTKEKAAIELAKYYEHKEKNYKKAIFYCEIVSASINDNQVELNKDCGVEIEKRLSRLMKKYSKNIPRASAKNE